MSILHGRANAVDPGEGRDLIHVELALSPGTLERFEGHIEADLVTELEAVGDRLGHAVDADCRAMFDDGYFHKAAGINGVAQIAKDIGAKAHPRTLAKAAASYENSSVRRLGYLLEQAGHTRQANALEHFVKKAKTAVSLDPSVKPLIASLTELHERDAKWKLVINEPVEIDF